MTKKKIFSIIVATYNSESYIRECLNSTKFNKYKYLELVICDDCSVDNTQKIIEEWIQINKKYFINITFIKQIKNVGTVKNIFTGINNCKGDFLKLMAGDDILFRKAIDNAYEIFDKKPKIELFFGTVFSFYYDDKIKKYYKYKSFPNYKSKIFFKMDQKKQYFQLCLSNPLNATGAFFKRSFFKKININKVGYLKYIEDKPMWLIYTRDFNKVNYYDIETCYYRLHNDSLTTMNPSKIVTKPNQLNLLEDRIRIIEKEIIPYYKRIPENYRKRIQKRIKDLKTPEDSQKNSKIKKALDPYILKDYLSNKFIKVFADKKKLEEFDLSPYKGDTE